MTRSTSSHSSTTSSGVTSCSTNAPKGASVGGGRWIACGTLRGMETVLLRFLWPLERTEDGDEERREADDALLERMGVD